MPKSELKQVKLLIFAKHLDGGTGTFVEQLVKLEYDPTSNVTVDVIALEKPQFRKFSLREDQIKYFSDKQLLPYAYLLTPSALLNFIHEIMWFYRQIRKRKPDIILSIDNHCNVLTSLIKTPIFSSGRIKIVLTIHNNISAVVFSKLPLWSKGLFQGICQYLFSLADKIVCVSQGVALDTKQFFSLKRLPEVIHVAVDIDKIQKLSKNPIPQDDKIKFRNKALKIISVGRFAPQKDFETLIEAMTLIESPVQLYLIGDGPDKGKLLRLVKKCKLEKVVHFLGWKQNIYPYIRAADIFVLSSHYEGFPYVLLEAAALAKPIVATDTPYGPREFLGDNTYGLLVPMNHPKELAQKILLLMNKENCDYYQSQIKKRVNNFSERFMLLNYSSQFYTIGV